MLPPSDRELLEGLELGAERVWDDDPALADAAVRRVMLLGDIHNQRQVLDAALRTATDQNCDVLVQVGDFWLQDSTWELFSPQHAGLMLSAVRSAIPVIVVDGNHEVWPCLSRFLERDDTITARADNRPLHLGGSLWWADRGSVWSWSGRQFGALGGAASPDRWRPAAAGHRWDQETTTPQDLDRLLDNAVGGLDVLICHDAPAGTTGLVSGLRQPMPTGLQRQSDAVQELLRTAVDAAEPPLVFHGHWHQPNRCRLNACSEVVGLDADGCPAAQPCCQSATSKSATSTPSSARTTAADRPANPPQHAPAGRVGSHPGHHSTLTGSTAPSAVALTQRHPRGA